ncbi:MAG: 4Fe-4S dicluster domain-containing protein [Pseudomonadota bacterium]
MDKQALQHLENQCIQDEPPQCLAACPLHLDARALVRHIRQNDPSGAWAVIRKTMPIPGILGRICDGPCLERCRRSDAGGSIRINELEKALVSQAPPAQRIRPLPSKGQTVAVIGAGISSLTAAWDLGRKGYDVRLFIFGPDPGAHIGSLYGPRIPRDVIDSELELLKSVNVTLVTGASADTPEFPETMVDGHDAVYLGLDAIEWQSWGLPANPDGTPVLDPVTYAAGEKGLFAGGLPRNGRVSPVWQAAQGRWAATSVDRYLQSVSLTAGREKQGPHATRLFTSLSGVEPRPPAAISDPAGYTWDEAVLEAGRCLDCQCLECVKVCPFLESFKAYPKRYAREIYNNESIVMGARQSNRLINSCSLCGLCQEVCPENFAMQDLCLTARQGMVARGKMPPSAHEFALLDMAFSQGESFALARHEPGHDTSAHLFFPGCQLCASSPEKVPLLYRHLRATLEGGVGLMLDCCAAPALWAGQEHRFKESLALLENTWITLGRPELILACSTCLGVFKDHLPGTPATSLWEKLADKDLPEGAGTGFHPGPLAVHDPCTARHEPRVRQSVRTLLERLNARVEELALSHEKTECCGFGGLMENASPDLAKEVVRRRAAQSPLDYLTYCAMCRDALAGSGKRVLHLSELIFPDPAQPDPASRKRPTWSRRRDNRVTLKAELLENLWGETRTKAPGYQDIIIDIPPMVAQKLDERRILIQDIKQVIFHVRSGGAQLYHPETGRYKAMFKLLSTTFWVEYTPSGNSYVIHTAYAHRMEVIRP